MPTFKIAAVQTAPVFMDREATVAKACELIAEAGQSGAGLVVFPEAFIPTYPDWVWRIPPGEHGMLADLYAELLEQSVTLPGPATDQLCQAARKAGVYVVIGLNERTGQQRQPVQHPALHRRRGQLAGQAPEAGTDRSRAHGLGPG